VDTVAEMAKSISTNWTKVSNLFFIASCIVLSTIVVIEYTKRNELTATKRPQAREEHATGLKVPLEALGSKEADSTMLIVFSPGCIYCQNSLPFYARLIEASRRSSSKARVIFASSQPPEKTAFFFKNAGLDPDIIVLPLEVPAKGTPSLFIFDRTGALINSWLGQLSPDQEKRVLGLIDGF